MFQSLSGCWTINGIDGEAEIDKILGGVRNICPVFYRFEFVVPVNDGLHFLLLSVTVEWSVACEEEVGDDTHCPYINRSSMTSCQNSELRKLGIKIRNPTPFENLWSHVLDKEFSELDSVGR